MWRLYLQTYRQTATSSDLKDGREGCLNHDRTPDSHYVVCKLLHFFKQRVVKTELHTSSSSLRLRQSDWVLRTCTEECPGN